MPHAKSAVADGRWARVGSTNLNLSSWIGNWELDVAIEDNEFAEEMEEMYLDDLEHATEIVLSAKNRVRPAVDNAVGAAIKNSRLLGPTEAKSLAIVALLLAVLTVVALL
jgi:cardiolipin synthase A/B